MMKAGTRYRKIWEQTWEQYKDDYYNQGKIDGKIEGKIEVIDNMLLEGLSIEKALKIVGLQYDDYLKYKKCEQ